MMGGQAAVLGGQDFILSQRSGVEEELFKGVVLGVDADVAGLDLGRQTLLRTLDHLPEGLEPAPRFLERVAIHYARNALVACGALPGPVPLILGIWGPKVSLRGAACEPECQLQRLPPPPTTRKRSLYAAAAAPSLRCCRARARRSRWSCACG